MNIRTKRFRTIAVAIPAGTPAGIQIPIPDQDDLREAYIEGIETFSLSDAAATPQGLPVVSDGDATRLSITLVDRSTSRVKQMPYAPTRRTLNAGMVREIRDLQCTWTQSSILVTDTIQASETTWALLGVHYRYDSDL
jgi:hypothetical protein